MVHGLNHSVPALLISRWQLKKKIQKRKGFVYYRHSSMHDNRGVFAVSLYKNVNKCYHRKTVISLIQEIVNSDVLENLDSGNL